MKVKINFSDFWKDFDKKDNYFWNLLSERFDLELSETPDFLIYSSKGNEHTRYKCIKIFYTGENVRPDFLECDFAFSFDSPTTEHNYRLPLFVLYDDITKLRAKPDIEKILKEKTKFCNFVYSNGAARERIDFFHQLSHYKKVDAGGKVLNNIGHTVKDKVAFLSQYKFTIAFENECYPGYTTEKIFQPMLVNSIPIYWGNPVVNKDFNSRSFIDVQTFKDFDEAIERIKLIDNDPELYVKLLSEPYFENNEIPESFKRENILDKFQYIFKTAKDKKPVSLTLLSKVVNMKKRIFKKYKTILNR